MRLREYESLKRKCRKQVQRNCEMIDQIERHKGRKCRTFDEWMDDSLKIEFLESENEKLVNQFNELAHICQSWQKGRHNQ